MKPIPANRISTNGSDRDVPRPGPTNLSRLAMLVWFALPMVATPARAAGCHVPDRPALGERPSGRADAHIAAWVTLDAIEVAPPVLRRLPCPGETPQTSVIAMVPAGAACLVGAATPSDAPSSSSLVAFEDVERLDPLPFRLDRPPR